MTSRLDAFKKNGGFAQWPMQQKDPKPPASTKFYHAIEPFQSNRMRLCPRCQAHVPHDFDKKTPCPECGYPGLKPMTGWCRHPELRMIREGEHRGKIECLTPGCSARFAPHTDGVRDSWWVKHAREYRWVRGPDDIASYRGEWIRNAPHETVTAADKAFLKTATPRTFYVVGFNQGASWLVACLPDNKEAEPPAGTGWGWWKEYKQEYNQVPASPTEESDEELKRRLLDLGKGLHVTKAEVLAKLQHSRYGRYLRNAELCEDGPGGRINLRGRFLLDDLTVDCLASGYKPPTEAEIVDCITEDIRSLLPRGVLLGDVGLLRA